MKIAYKCKTMHSKNVLGSCQDVAKELAQIGFDAAVIADYNTTSGFADWHTACKNNNIHAIFGAEFSITIENQKSKLWASVIAQSGFKTLFEIIQLSRTDNLTPTFFQNIDLQNCGLLFFQGDCQNLPFLDKIASILEYSNDNLCQTERCTELEKQGYTICQTQNNKIPNAKWRNAYNATFFDENQNALPASCVLYNAKNNDFDAFIFNKTQNVTLPTISLPTIQNANDKLHALLFNNHNYSNAEKQRLNQELEIIQNNNFQTFFLIVADLIQFANQNNITLGIGRGSACSSFVLFRLGAHQINPLKYNLNYERFLNNWRKTLPDIDIDVEPSDKPKLIEYLQNKYDAENTAKISTFFNKSELEIIKNAFNAANVELNNNDYFTLNKMVKNSKDLNTILKQLNFNENTQKIITQNYHFLQNAIAGTGTHPSAFIISNQNINQFAPIENGKLLIDKHYIETLNAPKLDLLNLNCLSLFKSLNKLKEFQSFDENNPIIYDFLKTQNLCGIFQLEANTCKKTLAQIKPKNFTELCATIAIARPAIIDNGGLNDYLNHNSIADDYTINILNETRGVIIFQEQIIEILKIAKFQNKTLFNAFQSIVKNKNKNKNENENENNNFQKLFIENYPIKQNAQQLWNKLNNNGKWLMNKAHCIAYAKTAAFCTWLKATNTPTFYAELLNQDYLNNDKKLEIINELLNNNFNFEPFNIQKSKIKFHAENNTIIGGFLNIKGFSLLKAQNYFEKQKLNKLIQKDFENAQFILNTNNSITLKFLHITQSKSFNNMPIANDFVQLNNIENIAQHNNNNTYNTIAQIEKINFKDNGDITIKIKDDTHSLWAKIKNNKLELIKQAQNLKENSFALFKFKLFFNMPLLHIQKFIILE